MIQGKPQGCSGQLHAIIRNFVLDLVTDIEDVTIDGVSLSFFWPSKSILKKGATLCLPAGPHPCCQLKLPASAREVFVYKPASLPEYWKSGEGLRDSELFCRTCCGG